MYIPALLLMIATTFASTPAPSNRQRRRRQQHHERRIIVIGTKCKSPLPTLTIGTQLAWSHFREIAWRRRANATTPLAGSAVLTAVVLFNALQCVKATIMSREEEDGGGK